MKINEALLYKLKNRFAPNSYKRSSINIYKKRETLYNHSSFAIKSNELCSNILSRYKIGKLEISSEYFQFLSYFFMPDRKTEAKKAAIYKEKYLKAKEINKLSETIFNKKEKEANTIFTALEREYINLKSEYIIQTKEKNSIKENEEILLEELKNISSLDTETLELMIETLYVEKIKRERNPHGPKQIARLIKNSSNNTQKREFLRLYKEFDKLNSKEIDSTKIVNIENIFIQIKELIVNSKEFISNELSKEIKSIKDMPKSIIKNIHQDLRVFEKQMPILLNSDVKSFEPIEKSIFNSTVKERREKEFIEIIHNYQNLTQKDEKDKSIYMLHKYLFEKEIINIKDEKPYIFITSQIKKDISKKIENFLHKNIKDIELIKNRLITNNFFNKRNNQLKDIRVEKEEATIVKNIYNLVKEQIVEDNPMTPISANKKKTIYKEISKILTKKQEITTKEIKMLSSIVKENSNSVQYKEQFSMLIDDINKKSIIKHVKVKDSQETKDIQNLKDIRVEKEEATIVKNIYNLVKEQIVEDNPMTLISANKKKTIYKEISKILTKKQEITTKEIKMLSSIVKENSNSISIIRDFTDSQKYYIKNSTSENIENNIKYISGRHKTSTNDNEENQFIKNLEVGKQHETIVNFKKENIKEYVSQTVLEKRAEVEEHINRVIINMDDNIDALALKIFREIKDEINMEYRRL